MGKLIYVADDEVEIRVKISSTLGQEGFEVRCFETGDALLMECRRCLPDLVLLDIVMPGTDGLTCCSLLRRDHKDLPILIISAKDTVYDRITALSIGCDDYLGKPFHPLELTLRVKSLIRRGGSIQKEKKESRLQYGPLTLLPGQMMSLNNGDPIHLALGEYNFLSYVIQQPGQSASREELMKNLWRLEEGNGSRVVDYLVKRLRKRLKDHHAGVTIETVWGYGFRLGTREEA